MIDAYLSQLAQQLRLPHHRRRRVLREVGDHLDDAVAQLIDQGLDPDVAQRRAMTSFGDVDLLAEQFNRQAAVAATRRAPLLMAACGVAVIGGFFGAAMPQPTPVPSAAPLLRQVAFFVGVIGIQIAVVAGARTAARVASAWRTVPSSADVRLIRHAAAVFLAGLTATVLGWGIALLDVTGTRPDARLVPLIAGLAAMVAGAAVAATVTIRSIKRGDASPDELGLVGTSPLAIGERVFDWARSHPVVSCSFVAVASGVAAMVRAETTAIGALPWGLAQAAAVVAGYVALGPALELRT